MRQSIFLSTLLSLAFLTGCQSMSPEQQHAADQSTCSGYGYKPDSKAFADCMMKVDNRRQDQAEAQQDRDAIMKALSIRRNGDTRYPVCSAAMMDAQLDTENNAWYGPNCRQK